MPVYGYEKRYTITTDGVIKNKKGKEMAQFKTKQGYVFVLLSKDGIRKQILVHRAVAMSFLGIDPVRDQVNHIDGDKANNNLSNLEWVTCKENIHHYIENRSKILFRAHMKKYTSMIKEINSSVKNEKIVLDTYSGIFYKSMREACLANNCPISKMRIHNRTKVTARFIYV